EEGGDLAVVLHGDAVLAVGATEQGVLAKLAGTVGKLYADGSVLAGRRGDQVAFEGILPDLVAELLLAGDGDVAEHIARCEVVGGVEVVLQVDEDVGHEPVDG